LNGYLLTGVFDRYPVRTCSPGKYVFVEVTNQVRKIAKITISA